MKEGIIFIKIGTDNGGRGSEKMHLRPLKEKDAEGMLEWMHDPESLNYFQSVTCEKTREEVLKFITSAETVPIHGKSIHFAIADEDDDYLGTVSLKNVDMVNQNAEYAISLRKCAQGKGVAFWATGEILERAFREYRFQKIYLNVLEDNVRAIRLYEKCGFVFEGLFRRHLYLKGEFKALRWYSILEQEYHGGKTR